MQDAKKWSGKVVSRSGKMSKNFFLQIFGGNRLVLYRHCAIVVSNTMVMSEQHFSYQNISITCNQMSTTANRYNFEHIL